MDNLIQELLELRVEVRSGGASSDFVDTGVLEACSENWLKLRKDNGELLYFSREKIRLIKPIEKPAS